MQDEFDSFEHKNSLKVSEKKIHKVIKSHQNLTRYSKVLKNLVTKVTLILGCNNVALCILRDLLQFDVFDVDEEEERKEPLRKIGFLSSFSRFFLLLMFIARKP